MASRVIGNFVTSAFYAYSPKYAERKVMEAERNDSWENKSTSYNARPTRKTAKRKRTFPKTADKEARKSFSYINRDDLFCLQI